MERCLIFNTKTPKIFDEFDSIFENFGSYNSHFLPVDIKDFDDKVEVYAEIPGFEKNEIDIRIQGKILTLKGEKKKESNNYFNKKGFVRALNLDDTLDPDKIEASLKGGILTISLPKIKKKSKLIEIK